MNRKASQIHYFLTLLWVAVSWLSASGPLWATLPPISPVITTPPFEIFGVSSKPTATMVPFSATNNWGSTKRCYNPTLNENGQVGADAHRWAQLYGFMLEELKKVINSKRALAKSQIGLDSAPPKWWRDLLAAYTTLVSYTPFDKWEGYLQFIDPLYTISDGRVYCFDSGDRGGWVLDRTFSDFVHPSQTPPRKHVIFFTMGTQNQKQMDANTNFLPYYARLDKIIRKYQEEWLKLNKKAVSYEDRFCPGLVWFEGNGRGTGADWSTNYIYDSTSPTNGFTSTTISLGALRGIRAACWFRQGSWLVGRDEQQYNPLKDFFTDIQYAHVTFAGHSRGGIAEGLAAFVAVHKAGQTIRSLRVVGLATPAASNLLEKYSKPLPNGKEFTRIVIQNQSSDLAGLGADQIPRMGSEGGLPISQQWTTGLGLGFWNVDYGQQNVSYLYEWAVALSKGHDPLPPIRTMIRRNEGEVGYLFDTYALGGASQNFASLALPHWAGIYAAGIIGQSYWNTNLADYFRFLSDLEKYQELSLKKIKFNSQIWLPTSWLTKQVLTPEQYADVQVVRRAFLVTEFKDRDDKPGGSFDPSGDLWTFFYMSEAALAATQSSSMTALPDGFLPGTTYYSEGFNLVNRFNFVHIRHARDFCTKIRSPTCPRWVR